MGEVLVRLRDQFGAVSCEGQAIHGQWQHGGQVYRDDLVRVFVDVEDTAANREFFVQFKELLKETFDQIDIWMTTYPLDVI